MMDIVMPGRTPRSAAAVRAAVVAAAEQVVDTVSSVAAYGHTSHLAVQLYGELVYDRHLRGPEQADVFSVTKTVLATLVGVAVRDGVLPAQDQPLRLTLPLLEGTPASEHTWRQLLTMTRGSAVEGPWEVDEVTALLGGQVAHIAAAPQLTVPGSSFRYDNGGAHLLSAALAAVVGTSVAEYARREPFGPLGIVGAGWMSDPDGVSFGYGHLRLSAHDLLRLGSLWLDQGRWRGEPVADPSYVAAMTSAQTPGGPPEGLGYGYLTWVGEDHFLAGGWAGQHVLVLPGVRAVVVTTGDPGFRLGPPPTDELPADWRPALDLVRRFLLPVLTAAE